MIKPQVRKAIQIQTAKQATVDKKYTVNLLIHYPVNLNYLRIIAAPLSLFLEVR